MQGQWLPLGLTVDDINGLVLTVDVLSGEEAATLKEWVEPIAAAVGAQVLVSDDADGFKIVADELGLISGSVKQFSDGIRQHRNLVHPDKERRESLTVDQAMAQIASGALDIIIDSIRKAP